MVSRLVKRIQAGISELGFGQKRKENAEGCRARKEQERKERKSIPRFIALKKSMIKTILTIRTIHTFTDY